MEKLELEEFLSTGRPASAWPRWYGERGAYFLYEARKISGC